MTDSNKEKFYQEVGFIISDLRKNAEMSQQTLAEKVGLSRTSIVNIEKGRQYSPLHVLWEITQSLQVELSMLIPDLEYERNDINPSLKNLVNSKKKRDNLNDDSINKINSFLKKSFR